MRYAKRKTQHVRVQQTHKLMEESLLLNHHRSNSATETRAHVARVRAQYHIQIWTIMDLATVPVAGGMGLTLAGE